MRPIVVFALALAACNSTKNPVTKSGTTLFEWDYTKASRAPFAAATVGTRTSKDFLVDVHVKDTPPFSVLVHADFAPVDFVEDGKPRHHTAPVAIKATVKDNDGWDLSGKCDEGPSYPMAVDDAGALTAPLAMVQDCLISHHRKTSMSSWELGFTLNVYGDGTMKPFPPEDVTITPK